MSLQPPPEQYISFRDQDAIEIHRLILILKLPNQTALCHLIYLLAYKTDP